MRDPEWQPRPLREALGGGLESAHKGPGAPASYPGYPRDAREGQSQRGHGTRSLPRYPLTARSRKPQALSVRRPAPPPRWNRSPHLPPQRSETERRERREALG